MLAFLHVRPCSVLFAHFLSLRFHAALPTDEQFITTIYDLFGAGSETSSNTMEFAIYFVMRHPSVQEKVFQEIETVIGQNRGPNAGDRNV